MSIRNDLTGKKFGKLTVNNVVGFTKARNSIWSCSCECGGCVDVVSTDLTRGRVKSCGCGRNKNKSSECSLDIKILRKFNTAYNHMIARVYGNREFDSQYYKNRIFVCDKWLEFNGFKEDMWDSYILHIKEFGLKHTTLDREDNNKNYCKENCRWATLYEQVENRRNQIEFKAISPSGEIFISKNQRRFSNEHGLNIHNFKQYIDKNKTYKGWKFERVK